MKMSTMKYLAILVAIVCIGCFIGCGVNSNPPQKKQDGIPNIVTDSVPGEPSAAQEPSTTQEQSAAQEPSTAQEPSADAGQNAPQQQEQVGSLKDAIQEK